MEDIQEHVCFTLTRAHLQNSKGRYHLVNPRIDGRVTLTLLNMYGLGYGLFCQIEVKVQKRVVVTVVMNFRL